MRIDGAGLPYRLSRDEKKSERAANKPSGQHDSIALRGASRRENPVYSIEVRQPAKENKPLSGEMLGQLRSRSSDGYYEKDEVRRLTSEKIMGSAEFSDVVSDYFRTRVSGSNIVNSGNNEEKIAEIRKKAATGFYDDPANFGIFAEKLIKSFGL